MIVASPLNGGAGLTGKSGRKTANASNALTKETNIKTAAHFIFTVKNASYRRFANPEQSRCQRLLGHVDSISFVGGPFANSPINMFGLVLSPANRKRI
jgi:hypothetical protein